jgi:hypothetical protein
MVILMREVTFKMKVVLAFLNGSEGVNEVLMKQNAEM